MDRSGLRPNDKRPFDTTHRCEICTHNANHEWHPFNHLRPTFDAWTIWRFISTPDLLSHFFCRYPYYGCRAFNLHLYSPYSGKTRALIQKPMKKYLFMSFLFTLSAIGGCGGGDESVTAMHSTPKAQKLMDQELIDQEQVGNHRKAAIARRSAHSAWGSG
jgi:hypothetical protein